MIIHGGGTIYSAGVRVGEGSRRVDSSYQSEALFSTSRIGSVISLPVQYQKDHKKLSAAVYDNDSYVKGVY